MHASRRDPALDVIRGLCIVSMVVGHLADGSPLYQVTHGQIWVDGATGFVLLAGLVLGMVQRRMAAGPGVRLLARRARVVWSVHVALVVLALALAPWRQMWPAATPTADQQGGWPSALWNALTLRVNPVEVDILSMYVVLFAVAAVAILLVRLRLGWLAVVISGAGYLAALANPARASLPRTPDGGGSHFDVGTWQLLFVAALLLGWYWHSEPVQRALASRRLLHVALASTLAALLLHQAVERFGVLADSPGLAAGVRTAFDNSTIGIGRILLAFCVFFVLYRLLRSVRLTSLTAPLVVLAQPLGRRSLAAYVILSGVDLTLGSFAPYEPDGLVGMQWAVVVVAIAWWWSLMRDRPGVTDRHVLVLPHVPGVPRRAQGLAVPAPGERAPGGLTTITDHHLLVR